MKGFKDSNNKFHPITDYKKGTRKSRDQEEKTRGVRIRKAREPEEQLVERITHIIDATKKGEPIESIIKEKPQRHVAGKIFTLPSGAKASYEKVKGEKDLVLHYHSKEGKQKDIDYVMERVTNFKKYRKEASLTKDQAVSLVKKVGKPLMFYIDPEEQNYFTVEKLRFNDTKVRGIWMLGDYTDKHGNYYASFPITSPEHWNELVDEGRFIGYNEDGTVNTDFKTRDRSKDK
ncbi:MAG: hypothetical protein KJI69_03730 [Patescibacteria group bacterium]|nr:hypothetical protein [Patescibacteria group bacterium]